MRCRRASAGKDRGRRAPSRARSPACDAFASRRTDDRPARTGRLLLDARSLPLLPQELPCSGSEAFLLQLERRRVSEVLRLRSHHFGAQEGAEKEGGLQHRPQRHGGGGALPRLSGDSSESRCKGGALARQKHFGLRCNDDRQRGGVLPKPQARGTRGGHCSRRGRRDPVSPLLPSGSGTRIPHARPQRADAFRR